MGIRVEAGVEVCAKHDPISDRNIAAAATAVRIERSPALSEAFHLHRVMRQTFVLVERSQGDNGGAHAPLWLGDDETVIRLGYMHRGLRS